MRKVRLKMPAPRFFVRLPTADTDSEALDLAEGAGAVGPAVLLTIPSGGVVGSVEVAPEAGGE